MLVVDMKVIRVSKGKYIYFIESTSLKIGQMDEKNQYVLYDGMKKDFKLGCTRHCRSSLSSDYLLELDWEYTDNGVSLSTYIPKGSIIVGAINEYVINQGSRHNINIDYSDDTVLRVKRSNQKEYDKIHISPIKNIDVDKTDKELENNIVGPYKDEKITQTGAEELDEIDNLRNILYKSDNAIRIGRGAGREAYDISECNIRFLDDKDGNIIKVAINEDAVKYNKRELQTWQTAKGTKLEEYFCPITNFGSDHKYIVMEKAKVFDEFDISETDDDLFDKWSKWSDKLEENINKHTSLPTRDICYDNIGIYNDRHVLIDYPFGGFIEDSSSKSE